MNSGFVWADDGSPIRLSLDAGYGVSSATQHKIIRSEDPIAFGVHAEYSLSSTVAVTMGYHRSLALSPDLESSISLTGIGGKYYFWNPIPQNEPTGKAQGRSYFYQREFAPYVGGELGYAQASFVSRFDSKLKATLPADNAVGIYVCPHLGMDYPLMGRWGIAADLGYGISLIGNASFEFMHLLLGVYVFL